METETLSNKTTHETTVEDSAGNTQTVTETTTQETDVVIPEAVETESDSDDDEGIDETWLEERFSRLGAQLADLQTMVAANQLSNLETTNRLLEMNQQLQATITTMAEKMMAPALNSSTPPTLSQEPIPVVVTENPADAAPDAPVEAPTAEEKRKVVRRKI